MYCKSFQVPYTGSYPRAVTAARRTSSLTSLTATCSNCWNDKGDEKRRKEMREGGGMSEGECLREEGEGNTKERRREKDCQGRMIKRRRK